MTEVSDLQYIYYSTVSNTACEYT